MPVSAETLQKLMAAGLVGDALLDVVRSIDADNVTVTSVTPPQPEKPSTIRMRRLRQLRRDAKVTLSDAHIVTIPSPPPAPSPDKEISPAPLLENNLFPEPPPQPRVSSAREFDAFWAKYPNKVGKADAFKAFDRAVKRVDVAAMMAGLDRYIGKTDDRPWCNPATWLNQDRWADAPAPQQRAGPQRGPSALEMRSAKLREKIENDYGIGRQGGGDPQDAGVLRIAGGAPVRRGD